MDNVQNNNHVFFLHIIVKVFEPSSYIQSTFQNITGTYMYMRM
jgi:hypothetical protein